MNSETQTDERLKIAVVSAKDQTVRIQGAIARRAFLRSGGYIPGHELENWRHTKSKFVKALLCGMTIRDQEIWVGTDAGEFEEGTIEIWVSPRHVTICGKLRGSRTGEAPSGRASREIDEIGFRLLELPVEIEPSDVTANFNGSLLEMCFPKRRREQRGVKHVAA